MSYISKLSLTEVTAFISTILPEEPITKIIKHGEEQKSKEGSFIRVITKNTSFELTDFRCQILFGDKTQKEKYQQAYASFMYQKFKESYLTAYEEEHFNKKIEQQQNKITNLTEQISEAKEKIKKLEERAIKERDVIQKQAFTFSQKITEAVSNYLQATSDNIDFADTYRESPLFEIIDEDGEKYLHFSGYYYGQDDTWHSIEYPASYISLQDYLDSRVNPDINLTEEFFAGTAPATVTKISRDEVNTSLGHLLKDRTSLSFFDITIDTPCGEYYAPTGKNHRYSVTVECNQLKPNYYVIDNKTHLPVSLSKIKILQDFPREASAKLFCNNLNRAHYQKLNAQEQISTTENQVITR